MNRFRYTMFVVTVFLVFALSAMSTMPALADDGAPPPLTDVPVVVDPPTEPVTAEGPAPVADLLASVPEGTEVVVMNAEGETLPLASSEAAEIVASNDPQWCPAGVTPGSASCSGPKTSFNGGDPANNLIQWLTNNPQSKAGVIWIEAGYVGNSGLESGTVVLNGGSLTSMANFALTINGGWISGTTLNPNTPSTFNVPFSIISWTGSVTLNNILVTGANGPVNALRVFSVGNITLNNVDVLNNTTSIGGALLLNQGGTGSVIINDSTFNGNTGYGLRVQSSNSITAKNLSANENTGEGAWFWNPNLTPGKPVTITGSNSFSFNGLNGLYITSSGAITLSNITAIYNSNGSGAYLDNCSYDYGNFWCNVAPANVTLTGANNFSNNGWDGLRVWSGGTITLANITANDNGTAPSRPIQVHGYDAYGKGVFLNNYGAWTSKAITLTGTNTFQGNASAGLYDNSWGKVSINNLTASGNGTGCDPLNTYENSSRCDGAQLHATGGILLSGYAIFEDNYDDGLEAHSYGSITLNNIYAVGNDSSGALVNSYGPAAAVVVMGTNVFNDNIDTGLTVWSEGVVTLSNITANNNDTYGVYAYNATKSIWDSTLGQWVDVMGGKTVTLTGANTFNGNIFTGLEVHSSGMIITSAVTALYNGEGVYLDNCLYDGLLDDCTGLPGKAVTMNGNNNINDNFGDGLYIESLGVIKVNNLTASNNGGTGATLDNNWNRATGGVTITGFSNTSLNGDSGLKIYSHGAVTTSNLTANDNGPLNAVDTFNRGVSISNATDPMKLMNVTLLGVNQFNGNWNTGLQIVSYGVITLNNITANNNGEPYDLTNNPTPAGYGINISNAGSTAVKAVTLNGINTFNGNLDGGLNVASKGAIVVNKVTANDNAGSGVYLYNQYDAFSAPVSILGYGTFNNNQNGGLRIFSNGAVTTSNLTANFNTGETGAYIYNYNNTLPASFVNVTMNGVNTFNGNFGVDIDGLLVYSDGLITFSNITANDNQGVGAYVNNVLSGGVLKNIVLSGNNTFVNNGAGGFGFAASGAVAMTRIISDWNTGDGVFGTAVGNITLTCGSLILNTGSGYNLTSTGGFVTLKGVFTFGNNLLDSASGVSATVVTRTCPLP